jgi:hypothetical protein
VRQGFGRCPGPSSCPCIAVIGLGPAACDRVGSSSHHGSVTTAQNEALRAVRVLRRRETNPPETTHRRRLPRGAPCLLVSAVPNVELLRELIPKTQRFKVDRLSLQPQRPGPQSENSSVLTAQSVPPPGTQAEPLLPRSGSNVLRLRAPAPGRDRMLRPPRRGRPLPPRMTRRCPGRGGGAFGKIVRVGRASRVGLWRWSRPPVQRPVWAAIRPDWTASRRVW